MFMRSASLALVVSAVAGCGASRSKSGPEVEEGFDCRSRRMAYEVTGSFGAYKSGVAALCEGNTPELVTFRQETAEDERKVEHHAMGSREFEALWEKIDSTGWRHLEDCDYIGLENDPQYVIMIGDHAADVKVSCSAQASNTGKKLQFPHEQIVNELDLKAGGLGGGF